MSETMSQKECANNDVTNDVKLEHCIAPNTERQIKLAFDVNKSDVVKYYRRDSVKLVTSMSMKFEGVLKKNDSKYGEVIVI